MSEIKRNGHGAMDMTQGPPTRLIVLFSLPLLAGNVLQQLYNLSLIHIFCRISEKGEEQYAAGH